MTLKAASLIEPCVKEVRAYFSNAKELMWKQMIKALYISLIIHHSIRCIVIIGHSYASLSSNFCYTS